MKKIIITFREAVYVGKDKHSCKFLVVESVTTCMENSSVLQAFKDGTCLYLPVANIAGMDGYETESK